MAVFKCKICGGNLEVQEGMSVCECEYCGTKQTLPKMNDERRANLYDRANHFRRNNEFDKAMGMYEQILQEDREDAEAYWSLVLCTYGIEYVEDPASHTRKPTVNRTQYTSVFADENYKAALRYADESQKAIYEEEAKQIDAIQKGILDISNKEEPFDVFICYKETDAAGQRTQDSVLANDLYHQLTQEGFKVFFARITLEDKLGSAYEPYIFAALNSAKVMVVLGTRPEYFNAVWVRNEWSRYLGLIKKGEKKVLIPAYKDMDPYDLPQEFSHLQSQDMGKLGFMQDLIRGIRKLTGADEKAQSAASAGSAGNEAAALLKRMFLFLEDGDFGKADEYSERVLNLDPENAEAYLGKLMAQLKVCRREELAQCAGRLDAADAYQKLMRFGGESLRKEAEDYNQQIIKRLNEEEEKQEKLRQEQEERQRETDYQGALQLLNSAVKSSQLKDVITHLQVLGEYKDAAAHMAATAEKLAQWEKKERAQRKRKGIMAAVFTTSVIVVAVVSLNIASAVKKRNQYNQAVQNAEYLLQEGNYESAYREFSELLGEEKAEEEIISAMYSAAVDYLEDERFQEAVSMLNSMSGFTHDYTKEAEQLGNAMYEKAQEYVQEGEYDGITELFAAIARLQDTVDMSEAAAELGNAMYRKAQEYIEAENYAEAGGLLSAIAILPDTAAAEQSAADIYRRALQCMKQGKEAEADEIYNLMNKLELFRIPIEETKYDLTKTSVNGTVYFGKTDYKDAEIGSFRVLERKESGEMLLEGTLTYSWNDSYKNAFGNALQSSWEDSPLRKWLNNDFLQECFSEEEQNLIMTSTLQNESYKGSQQGGFFLDLDSWNMRQESGETEDKIFLPLFSEKMEELKNMGVFNKIEEYEKSPASNLERWYQLEDFLQAADWYQCYRSSMIFNLYDSTESTERLINVNWYGYGTYENAFELSTDFDAYSTIDETWKLCYRMWVNPYME